MNFHSTEMYPKISLWKEHLENLLFKSNICGICLSEEDELDNLESIYHLEQSNEQRTLRDVLGITFGSHVSSLLPTQYICSGCVTKILQSYFIAKKIRANHTILQKYIDVLTQQATISSKTDHTTEKQLLLTIDNIKSLSVPTTVTVSDKENENNITQIFLCEVGDVTVPEFDFENSHLKYECPYCGKQFHDFVIFKDHYNLHNEIFFRCHKCSKRYKYFDDLIKHRNGRHSDVLAVCDICQIILLSPECVEHEKEHPGNFYCLKCQISFQLQTDLEEHNTEAHSYVTCQKCFKTFGDTLKLEQHRCLYKCSECKEDCIHEKYLDSYRKQHMAKNSWFKCPDCNFMYVSKNQIICHVNEQHLNHLPYLCDICGENFASRPNLTVHINKNHNEVSKVSDDCAKVDGPIVSSILNERPYECNMCGFFFNSEDAYKMHRRKHLTEQTKCHICKKKFCNIGQLNIHVKKYHPNELSNRNVIYRCTMCPLDFKLRSELLNHFSTHSKGDNHNCRECKQSFSSKKKYISHVRKHRISYDRTCPICLKKYTKHSISRHMRSHTAKELEKYICDVCAEILPNEKALLKHANKHTEQRQCPHCDTPVNSVLYSKHVSTHIQSDKNNVRNCTDCNYTTKFAVCLEAHINRHHLKVRPYKCDVCNKTFYSDYTLKGHKITHANERPEHYCHICGKKFISKKALIFHTRLHTGELPYPCDFCDLSFLSSSRRRQHMIRKHFEPQFECQVCSKKLYTQSDLRRHVSDCHDGGFKRKRPKKAE